MNINWEDNHDRKKLAATRVGCASRGKGNSFSSYSIKNFTSPPNLEISSPSTETVIRQDSVEVIGKTDEGCSLQINGQTIFIDEAGNFNEQVRLQIGINNIEIRSTNRLQKDTVKIVKILAEF